jgi:hypothetical protein
LPLIVLYVESVATSTERGDPFIFVIPSPRVRTIIALVPATLLLLTFSYIPFRIGLARFFYDLRYHPAMWFVSASFAVPIAFLLRLAFPPQGLLARLQFCPNSVSFIPAPVATRLFAESISKAAITPQSEEILLCHGALGEWPGGFGYRVIIRGTGESDHWVKAGYLALHNAHECQRIAEGIASATGLPVRIIKRQRLANGTIQEMPWMPMSTKTIWRVVAALSAGALPLFSGIIVGFLMPPPGTIVCIGLALWLCEMLVIFACAHKGQRLTGLLVLYSLTTLFSFGAIYGALVVIVSYMVRGH